MMMATNQDPIGDRVSARPITDVLRRQVREDQIRSCTPGLSRPGPTRWEGRAGAVRPALHTPSRLRRPHLPGFAGGDCAYRYAHSGKGELLVRSLACMIVHQANYTFWNTLLAGDS